MAAKLFNVVAVFDLQERIAIVIDCRAGTGPPIPSGAIVEFRNPDGGAVRRWFLGYDFLDPINPNRPESFSVSPGAERIEIGAEVWLVDEANVK